MAEGFEIEPIERLTARRAAIGLLRGRGLLRLLAVWVTAGRRPYPRWASALLGVGWLAVGVIILRLLVGPDPGRWLLPMSAALVALWTGLVLTALAVAGRLSPELRDVLLARYFDGESAAEIGARYGRTEQTITSWLRRAVAQMRASLAAPRRGAAKAPHAGVHLPSSRGDSASASSVSS